MDELRPWVRLTKTGASASRLNRLLDHFGSPEAFFDASVESICRTAGCAPSVAEKLLDPIYARTDRDIDLMERLGVRLVRRCDAEYPPLLKEIHDPPIALYVRGSLLPEDRKAVALVGSRRASQYGLRFAHQFACDLVGAGITVVSGLARGIDTAVHQGALKGGGRTLACLGCGIDVCYPYENRQLADAISTGGAVLSEYPMNAAPDAWHFPSRNRIVSGLSLGVVVLEAPKGSGALITAECAMDQNREVFAVPGNIDNPRNYGPHALIRDGAKLVERVEDILEELRLNETQPSLDLDLEETLPDLTPEEETLYALLDSDPKPVDDVILEASIPAARVSGLLLTLELKGVARRLPGNTFVRIR
jgi:DNA processing protein